MCEAAGIALAFAVALAITPCPIVLMAMGKMYTAFTSAGFVLGLALLAKVLHDRMIVPVLLKEEEETAFPVSSLRKRQAPSTTNLDAFLYCKAFREVTSYLAC